MSAPWPALAGESLPATPDQPGPTCNLATIARLLGRPNYKSQRLLRYVGLLIAEAGFPRPLPTLVKLQLVDRPTADSLWQRAAVEAWLDGQLPPPAAEALGAARHAAEHAAAAEAMDQAALNLRLIRGGRA